MDTTNSMMPDEIVMSKIYYICDQKVMLDFDFAYLYGVETKVLKQSVRRNLNRFPEDFMFALSKKEFEILRSQIVILKFNQTRYMPMAFTEHGVLMLSSVLRSERAVDINIQIVRIFTKMRKILMSQKDLIQRVSKIESNLEGQSQEIKILFEYLKKLMQEK
jgi:phage regulator Rha-like protein